MARTLAPSRNGKGGSWNRDGVVVYTPDSNTPLFAVPAAGGEPRQLTTLDEERGATPTVTLSFFPTAAVFSIWRAASVAATPTS